MPCGGQFAKRVFSFPKKNDPFIKSMYERNMAATDPMMRYETWANLVTMFFEKAAERSGKPFLWAKYGGVYKPLSWGETAARVRALAAELKA
ncbi:MAG TPA: hypothetical protein DCP05_00225, partial [Rhodospirillaceae bacterium]|nr:hypothetical protein [Rhodospirillaceae bacterium]